MSGNDQRGLPPTRALHTDRYELTMVDASLADGTGGRPCVFEMFTRGLVPGTRYGVVAGVDAAIEAVERFRFGPAEIDFLRDEGVVGEVTLEWLAGWTFTGDVTGYPDGEVYFPGSPVLTVEAPFADAVMLETVLLSAVNAASSVASMAAAMREASGDRSLLEMGSRRIHADAAVEAGRAAWIAGFDATSNLETGRRFGVPTIGTAAHAWTLVHDDESDAFGGQIDALGPGTTLLVDTFDLETGVRRAVQAARDRGHDGPGAVRVDSGDLAEGARLARRVLDDCGASKTRVVVSGDLDLGALRELDGAPIDGYGVGTHLVGAPPAGFVYKLVAVGPDRTPVAKTSPGKTGTGGRKGVVRRLEDGVAVAEDTRAPFDPGGDPPDGRTPQIRLMAGGSRVGDPDPVTRTRAARDRYRRAVAELPPPPRSESGAIPWEPGPAIPTLGTEEARS